MVPDPFHREAQVVLITALGHQVKNRVCAHEWIDATPVGRVGMEDIAVGVLIEDAQARASALGNSCIV